MKLVRFETKYGYKVIGGRFGNQVRSPSTTAELAAPIEAVDPALIAQAEADHLDALNQHRASWGLPPIQPTSGASPDSIKRDL